MNEINAPALSTYEDPIKKNTNLNDIIESQKIKQRYQIHGKIDPFFTQINKQNQQYTEKKGENQENLHK